MKFQLGCRLNYRTTEAVPFVFNLHAQSFDEQLIEQESLTITPSLPIEHWTMPESGNRFFRVTPTGSLLLEYTAIVELAPKLEDPNSISEIPALELPMAALLYLYPSRYCQSDRLARFAQSHFGGLAPGYSRVNAICNWLYDYVAYEAGVSDETTSAIDTVTERAGVCRDFAHLGIALCRALGIPARYISAYAFRLQPPDFHAVFEAFLNGPHGPAWYLFDPTRLADPAGLVRIGMGRDSAEVAFATFFGETEAEKPEVWIEALEPAPPVTVAAVRPS
ncbi:transglutaminase-like domain-containing protein [Humitalea sp. 24SJ18S-53]|uniref:transglutaminase-like domain-containing protein n=1 Tax=Humitalea sp. 24SJ18S-53 TaxID=3422307 RepID=UPI003D674A3E